MDNLQSVFDETLKREGKDIVLDNESTVRAFFRRNDKGEFDRYITMFVAVNQPILQGNIFKLNNVPYIVFKQLTPENSVYNKYICVQTNEHVKYMLRYADDTSKANLVEFDMFMVDSFADSVSSSGNVLVIASQAEFKLSLNDFSRRININERFFNEFYGAVWKIRDINYKDNMVSLYCERDIINPNDDAANGIADRWEFEHKPDTYKVTIAESTINVNVGAEQQLTVSVTKNGEPYEPTKPYIWASTDDSIAYVNEQNKVFGVKDGSCVVTANYKEENNDISVGANCDVTVEQNAEITINPPYDEDGRYGVLQYDTTTFTATISGVSNPQWSITLDPQGIPGSYYDSIIDNSQGTFTVTNNQRYNGAYLKYIIQEITSGKTTDYFIELASLF